MFERSTDRSDTRARFLTAAGLLVMGCLAFGCAQAEKTQYLRHLTTGIERGGTDTADILAAYRAQHDPIDGVAMAQPSSAGATD